MRRTKRIIAALIAAVLILALLSSCGSESAAGKYYIKSVSGVPIEDIITPLLAQNNVTLEEFLQECGISSLDEYYTIELSEDGTVTRRYPEMEPRPGTWKQSGRKVTTTFDGDEAEFTFKNGELTRTDEYGTVFIFVRK